MAASVPGDTSRPAEEHEGRVLGELRSARRRRAVRLTIAAVLVALVITFVVRNSQSVSVNFVFATRHPRLIWVITSCFLIGVVVGFVASGPARRSRGGGPGGKRQKRG